MNILRKNITAITRSKFSIQYMVSLNFLAICLEALLRSGFFISIRRYASNQTCKLCYIKHANCYIEHAKCIKSNMQIALYQTCKLLYRTCEVHKIKHANCIISNMQIVISNMRSALHHTYELHHVKHANCYF